MARPLALITGASSGIGLEIARELAAKGYDVFLVARRIDRLTQLAQTLKQQYGVAVWSFDMDLTKSESPKLVMDEVAKAGRTIDVLVNDAGLGHADTFSVMPWVDVAEQVNLNILALAKLTHLVLPGMLERKNGKILNLGSIAGYLPGPGMSVYYASKAFVISFSEALWQETRGTGVSVTCLCPGLTHTEFHQVAHMESGKLGWMNADTVAKIGVQAMLQGKRIVNAGAINTLFAWVVRFVSHRILLLAGTARRK